MWTPESITDLSTTLHATTLEADTMALINEFLAGYFDGTAHFGEDYPAAGLAFQIGTPTQPLDKTPGTGLILHVVGNLEGKTQRQRMHGKWVGTNKGQWTFYSKASVKTPRPDNLNSEALARLASDKLYGLMNRQERLLPLNRAGLRSISVQPPKLATVPEYAARSLVVRARLVFDITES